MGIVLTKSKSFNMLQIQTTLWKKNRPDALKNFDSGYFASNGRHSSDNKLLEHIILVSYYYLKINL